MTKSYEKHADDIVREFREFLSADLQEAVGGENFDRLSAMIEAALSASVLDVLEKAADQVTALGKHIREDAERFEH